MKNENKEQDFLHKWKNGVVSLFQWHINILGLSNAKSILQEEQW